MTVQPGSSCPSIRWRQIGNALLVGVLRFALGESAAAFDPPRPPNVILIVADDLGYGELGCYGQAIIKTPHLNRLAANGIRFTQFYAGSPVCAPSRCVLLTGKHSGHSFIRDNREVQPEGQLPLPAEEITIGERFQSSGYATAAIGKWGLGMVATTGDPNQQGFDLFFGYHCQRHAHNHYPRYLRRNANRVPLEGNTRGITGAKYSQDLFRDEALAFIRAHREVPFFLYLPFAVPHLGIQVPASSLSEYLGKVPEADYQHQGYVKHPHPRAGYAAMISHLDRDIGQLVELVEELSLSEQTLILFTSDNGPTYDRLGGSDSDFFQSTGPLRGRKGSVYEGGLRVPLLAQWTGHIAAGTVSDHVAGFCDVVATLVEISGLSKATLSPDGVSFSPTLLGEAHQPQHQLLYWEFPAYGGQQAARSGDWKLVRTNLQSPHGTAPPTRELYDLASDVGETVNVAGRNPDIVEKILAEMKMQHIPSSAFPFAALDNLSDGGAVERAE